MHGTCRPPGRPAAACAARAGSSRASDGRGDAGGWRGVQGGAQVRGAARAGELRLARWQQIRGRVALREDAWQGCLPGQAAHVRRRILQGAIRRGAAAAACGCAAAGRRAASSRCLRLCSAADRVHTRHRACPRARASLWQSSGAASSCMRAS